MTDGSDDDADEETTLSWRDERTRKTVWTVLRLGLAIFITFPLIASFGRHLGELYLFPAVASHLVGLVPVWVDSPLLPGRRRLRWGVFGLVFYVMLRRVIGAGWGGWGVVDFVAVTVAVYAIGSYGNRLIEPTDDPPSTEWSRHELEVQRRPDPWMEEAEQDLTDFVEDGEREGLRDRLEEEGLETRWLEEHRDPVAPKVLRWVQRGSWVLLAAFVAFWIATALSTAGPLGIIFAPQSVAFGATALVWAAINAGLWAASKVVDLAVGRVMTRRRRELVDEVGPALGGTGGDGDA